MAITIDQFLAALSGQESGGSYTAENARTGAYGRFQIMPANWPSWSREAGLPEGAQPTPENQERVARFKIQQYYNRFGNWEDVASAWYSGSPRSAYTPEQLNRKQGAGNEPSINEYVNSVMGRAGAGGTAMPAGTGTGDDFRSRSLQKVTELQEKLRTLMEQPAPTDPAAFNAWADQIDALNGQIANEIEIYRTYRPDTAEPSRSLTPEERAVTDFDARTKEFAQGIDLDELNLAQATQALNRFLGGLSESRQRAQQVQEGQETVRRYGLARNPDGTPKLDYSFRDLGASFEALAPYYGKGADDTLVRYPGSINIDPEGDMARIDRSLGVEEALPPVAELLSGAQDRPRWGGLPGDAASTGAGAGRGPQASLLDDYGIPAPQAPVPANPSERLLAQRNSGLTPVRDIGSGLDAYAGQTVRAGGAPTPGALRPASLVESIFNQPGQAPFTETMQSLVEPEWVKSARKIQQGR